jgi:hypothetical protein
MYCHAIFDGQFLVFFANITKEMPRQMKGILPSVKELTRLL